MIRRIEPHSHLDQTYSLDHLHTATGTQHPAVVAWRGKALNGGDKHHHQQTQDDMP